MSKMSEQKALEAYPRAKEEPYSTGFINKETLNSSKREGYIAGYDQAMKDIQEQAEKSVIEKSNGEVTIEDLVAYNQGFKTGRELAMQDFLEKAERYLNYTLYSRVEIEVYGTLIPSITNKKEFINDFKNYMQNESEN